MPVTYAVMMIGTIAITGLGIPGLDLGFAGFYSKDAIINAAFISGAHDSLGYLRLYRGDVRGGADRLLFLPPDLHDL